MSEVTMCTECSIGRLVSEEKQGNLYTRKFSCGHTQTHGVTESKIGVSAGAAIVFLIPKPVRALEDAIKEEDWFYAITISTAFFEQLGLDRLKAHFKARNIFIESEKFSSSLAPLTDVLYASGAIDHATYSKMIEVRDKRNDLLHDPKAQYNLNSDEAEGIVRKAIACIEALEKPASTQSA